MPIRNGHWESNFLNGYFSPIVVENSIFINYGITDFKPEKYIPLIRNPIGTAC